MTTRVGPMVATLARANGISQSQLAVEVKIHRNRLADKIAGRRAFTEQEIVDLAAYFRVPPGRLFDDPLELLGVGATSGSVSAWTRTAAAPPARHLRLVA